MTVPASQDVGQYVLPGGKITLEVIFQTYQWSGAKQPVSGTQITIAPAAGGSAVVGPTSAGVVSVDSATYSYDWYPPSSTAPGDYLVTWTATGTGPLAYTQVVTVSAPPQEAPAPGVYATLAQYRSYTLDQLTPDYLVNGWLRQASEVIDWVLIAAVYPTDADGMPTNPMHIDVFMRATCRQAQYMIAGGDPTYVKPKFSSTSMGGVSQTRSPRGLAILPDLAPQAAVILQTAGVLGAAPLVNY